LRKNGVSGSFANRGGSGLKPIFIGNVKGVAIFPRHWSSAIIQFYVLSRLAPDWGIGYSHGSGEVLWLS